MLHIVQNLCRTRLSENQEVYSKAQPFIQCRNWLKANLPNAKLIETSSTAEAARIASGEHAAAAIASDLAAETYNISILVRGIEDASANFTRFFVLGRQLAKPTGNDKTSILCSIKDRPGALYELLTPLREHKINLTRIESRPSRRKAWDYVFFIDSLAIVKRNVRNVAELSLIHESKCSGHSRVVIWCIEAENLCVRAAARRRCGRAGRRSEPAREATR